VGLKFLIHSFRHGVGRSTIAANLSSLMAAQEQRTAVVDTDMITPTLHTLFGIRESAFPHTLDDFLDGQVSLAQAAYPIPDSGQNLFLVSAHPGPMMNRTALSVQQFDRLNAGCEQFEQDLQLDALVLDTSPGLTHESLAALSIPDVFIFVLRHDRRDYQGTSVLIDVVRRLHAARVGLIVNEAPLDFDFAEMKTELEKIYGCEVLAILPYQQELMMLANQGIFVQQYPDHPFTTQLQRVVSQLASLAA
jgi:MinD-like ATPase involved in chromosome partitioning or flagellar assembly